MKVDLVTIIGGIITNAALLGGFIFQYRKNKIGTKRAGVGLRKDELDLDMETYDWLKEQLSDLKLELLSVKQENKRLKDAYDRLSERFDVYIDEKQNLIVKWENEVERMKLCIRDRDDTIVVMDKEMVRLEQGLIEVTEKYQLRVKKLTESFDEFKKKENDLKEENQDLIKKLDEIK